MQLPDSQPPFRPSGTPPPPITPDAPTVVTPPVGQPSRFGPMYGQARAQAVQQSKTLWSRFRGMPRVNQILIAVAAAMVVMVCSCCSCVGLAGALNGGSPTAQSTATSGNTGSLGQKTSATATATKTKATPTAQPTATAVPTATAKPQPKPTCIPGAVNCNPWGYNFTHGSRIYSPPGGFCGYFNCISSFWNGSGYVVQCQDGTYSKSGGHTGSCSRHGGDKRALLKP